MIPLSRRRILTLAIVGAVALGGCTPLLRKELQMASATLWPVDPLLKVFQDATPPEPSPAAMEVVAARNEFESAQFVLRSKVPLTNLKAHVVGLPTAVSFVGFVPLRANTRNTPEAEVVRKAPGLFPDPLLPPSLDRLEPETSLPIWVTIRVPKDARPGVRKARLAVECGQGKLEQPFTLRVTRATLPDKRTLWVTNWFSALGSRFKGFHGADDWSDAHWRVLEHYARVMADYRQNVVLTPIYSLIEFKAGPDGKLAFGFEKLDRWVKLFQDAGVIGLIEGGHLGGRDGGWTAQHFNINIRVVEGGKVVSKVGHPEDPPVEEFLSRFLPALQKHLGERGWLGIYLQHLCDEPIKENAESYRKLAALVKKHAPRLRRIDANHYAELVGAIDVWVPQLNYYGQSLPFYAERQKAGEEVWTYTCLAPTGTYPNRLIDYSLLKVRLLHWINFRFGATGYLHWGWNQWSVKDPFADVEPPHGPNVFLPPGDAWIVYPSKEHTLLSSIRFEAMRDGIEDYELLALLSEKSPEKAKALAERMVPNIAQPEKDIARFREVRRELLDALSH
jgi:hypothetical protein